MLNIDEIREELNEHLGWRDKEEQDKEESSKEDDKREDG